MSTRSSQTVLVTGGSGFIGKNFVGRLAQQPDCIACNLDSRDCAGSEPSRAGIANQSSHSFHRVDLTDPKRLSDAFRSIRPNSIVHLAAETHVDHSIDDPAAFVQSNLLGTFRLLEAARTHFRSLNQQEQATFRFVHVSTDEVYGSLGLHGLFTETSRYDPRSPYSATKAGSDHLANAWFHTYGLPVIVTHCSNNYGPFQQPEKLIPMMILRAIHERKLPVYGDGSNLRDWIHVNDHADALVQALRKGRPGESYNIGGDNERTNLEIVHTICDILDELSPRRSSNSYRDLITFVEDRPGHDFRYAIDSSKIRDELGWSPKRDFGTGLRATVRWYLDNEEWWRPIVDRIDGLRRVGKIET